MLGASNVTRAAARASSSRSRACKPTFVQNRCYARHGWDRDVRAVCRDHGIVYQGFSLLTANRQELATPARRRDREAPRQDAVPQIVFRFAQQLGMLPLTGTHDPEHMREDLAIGDFELTRDEVATLESVR